MVTEDQVIAAIRAFDLPMAERYKVRMRRALDAALAAKPAHPSREDRLRETHNPTPRLYVGSMNDSLYIIDKPPSPAMNDVGPWHNPNGPKIIVPCGVDAMLANRLVAAWNSILEKNADARAALADAPMVEGSV